MFETQKTNRGNTNQFMAWDIQKTVRDKVVAETAVQDKTEISVKVLELKKLSDQSLLSQTKYLVQKERNITIQVLRHLSEIESRKLYLKRGFSSLFDYVVKELGYGEGSAYRRIKAMKLCQEVPDTVSKLKAGSLNLTTVSKLQTYFEKQDKKAKKAKKAQTEFNLKNQEVDLAFDRHDNFSPAAGCVKDNKVMSDDKNYSGNNISKNEENCKNNKGDMNNLKVDYRLRRGDSSQRRIAASFQEHKIQKMDLLKKVEGKSMSQTEKILCEMDPETHQIKDKVRHLNKDQIEIKLTLDKSSYENLEKLKNLLSHKNPNMSYGELFKILSELGLDKYDPRQKLKKQNVVNPKQQTFENKNKCRGQLEKKDKTIKKNFPPEAACVRNNKEASQRKQSRYIPAQIKRLVWTRDQGQCTYICPETKKKCSSKHFLQIDHIHPYALGGSSELRNLRLLCAGHNQYRIFSSFRKKKIAAADLRCGK